MDVKAPLPNYRSVVGARVDVERIRNCIWADQAVGIPHEFKTTVVPGLHTTRELKAISEMIHGANRYVVQDFISQNPLRRELQGRPAFPHKPLKTSGNTWKNGSRFTKFTIPRTPARCRLPGVAGTRRRLYRVFCRRMVRQSKRQKRERNPERGLNPLRPPGGITFSRTPRHYGGQRLIRHPAPRARSHWK
jgi:hypothetical protein